jgi:hypothetical protein
MLCEQQYDLFSQYQVVKHTPLRADFTFATQAYIVSHKVQQQPSEHQVHVSPQLIYCPCGFFTAYLLPCRHVLAANGAAFADVFQPEQYHPRWWLLYSEQMQKQLLSKQFWINVGQEVTSEGLKRVRCNMQAALAVGEEEEAKCSEGASAAAAAPSSLLASADEYVLPLPMYPLTALELHPALLSPQQLYHMIEGECASLRQLACANPAKLSGLVWTELHQAKLRITQFIDREQRVQQQLNVSAAAAVTGGLTSEGIPLSALLAPVPLTLSKPGRPSNKRSLAATEGVAARKVRAMLPGRVAGVEGGTVVEQAATIGMSMASAAAVASAAAAATSSHTAQPAADAGGSGAGLAAFAGLSLGSMSAAGGGGYALSSAGMFADACAVSGSAAAAVAAGVRVSGRGRVLVRRAPFE